MTPISNLAEVRQALGDFLIARGAMLPTWTARQLQDLVQTAPPPAWVAHGLEYLWGARAVDGAAELAERLAEFNQRPAHRFYGEAGHGRAYAMLHVLKAARGDPDADVSAAAPEPLAQFTPPTQPAA